MDGENKGHGHVYKRPDGVQARCGGPRMCTECARDLAERAGIPASAQCIDEALALEAARGAEHIAMIRAEGWRAGAEAMREAIAKEWEDAGWHQNAVATRSIAIPEIDR